MIFLLLEKNQIMSPIRKPQFRISLKFGIVAERSETANFSDFDALETCKELKNCFQKVNYEEKKLVCRQFSCFLRFLAVYPADLFGVGSYLNFYPFIFYTKVPFELY